MGKNKKERGGGSRERKPVKRFVVTPYKTRLISIYDVIMLIGSSSCEHVKCDRTSRFNLVCKMNLIEGTYNKQAPVVGCFRVDRGHEDGKEIHVVTEKAIIFVLNEHKFNDGEPCVVTVLFARPAQLRWLYNPLGEKVPSNVLQRSFKWENRGLNHT